MRRLALSLLLSLLLVGCTDNTFDSLNTQEEYNYEEYINEQDVEITKLNQNIKKLEEIILKHESTIVELQKNEDDNDTYIKNLKGFFEIYRYETEELLKYIITKKIYSTDAELDILNIVELWFNNNMESNVHLLEIGSVMETDTLEENVRMVYGVQYEFQLEETLFETEYPRLEGKVFVSANHFRVEYVDGNWIVVEYFDW